MIPKRWFVHFESRAGPPGDIAQNPALKFVSSAFRARDGTRQGFRDKTVEFSGIFG